MELHRLGQAFDDLLPSPWKTPPTAPPRPERPTLRAEAARASALASRGVLQEVAEVRERCWDEEVVVAFVTLLWWFVVNCGSFHGRVAEPRALGAWHFKWSEKNGYRKKIILSGNTIDSITSFDH